MAKAEVPEEFRERALYADNTGLSFGRICEIFKRELKVDIKPTTMEYWLKRVRGLRSRKTQLAQFKAHYGSLSSRAKITLADIFK